MEFNYFLFPAPTSSYSPQSSLGELIYIPKYERDTDGNIIQFKAAKPDSPPQRLSFQSSM